MKVQGLLLAAAAPLALASSQGLCDPATTWCNMRCWNDDGTRGWCGQQPEWFQGKMYFKCEYTMQYCQARAEKAAEQPARQVAAEEPARLAMASGQGLCDPAASHCNMKCWHNNGSTGWCGQNYEWFQGKWYYKCEYQPQFCAPGRAEAEEPARLVMSSDQGLCDPASTWCNMECWHNNGAKGWCSREVEWLNGQMYYKCAYQPQMCMGRSEAEPQEPARAFPGGSGQGLCDPETTQCNSQCWHNDGSTGWCGRQEEWFQGKLYHKCMYTPQFCMWQGREVVEAETAGANPAVKVAAAAGALAAGVALVAGAVMNARGKARNYESIV